MNGEEEEVDESDKKSAPVKQEVAEAVRDGLSLDLDNYRVGWKAGELGPHKRSTSPEKGKGRPSKSRSPTRRQVSSLNDSVLASPSKILVSGQQDQPSHRPSSPSKKEISSKNSEPLRPHSGFDDYRVGWNLDELKGATFSIDQGHLSSSTVNSPITVDGSGKTTSKPAEIIKTDSFTITNSGKIIYK